LLAGPEFGFQWVVFSADVIASLGYAFVGVFNPSLIPDVNAYLKPGVDALKWVGMDIRQAPITGPFPEVTYRVMTAVQLWSILAYDIGIVLRVILTKRPLSEPREVVIQRLIASRGLSRIRAQMVYHASCLRLVAFATASSWCVLNAVNGWTVFHVDQYGALPIPGLLFVLPGALALPMCLGIVENIIRDFSLIYGRFFR
jgi:hypothetical protein